MELYFKSRERIKAFFKDGKPSVILKLKLPFAEGENELFVSRFNSFYEELSRAYISECRKCSDSRESGAPTLSFSVLAEEKHAPVGEVLVTRTHKLRFLGGENKNFAVTDTFALSDGLLRKEKKHIFSRKSRKV